MNLIKEVDMPDEIFYRPPSLLQHYLLLALHLAALEVNRGLCGAVE